MANRKRRGGRKRRGKKIAPKNNITSIMKSSYNNYISNLTMSRKLGIPMPEAFRTTLRLEWAAHYSAGGAANQDFQILASSPYYPLNPTAYIIQSVTMASPIGPAVGQPAGVTVATKIPSGYFLFQSPNNFSLYNQCHVVNAKCSVRFTPLALTDSINVTVYAGTGRDTRLVQLTGDASQQPGARTKLITSSNSDSEATVTCYVNCPDRAGVSLEDWLGEPLNGTTIVNSASTPVLQLPSQTNIQFFSICTSSADGDTTVTNIPYKIMLEYDVVFHGIPSQIIN